MAKRSGTKNNSKHYSSLKNGDNKALSIVDDNVLQNLEADKVSLKMGLIKSESAPLLLVSKSNDYSDIVPQRVEIVGHDKGGRVPKKTLKTVDDMDEIRSSSTLRLSHFVIVNSVLKETNINPNLEALLPVSLNLIYQKFINSKKYIDQCQNKDEFYCGVGLLGIGIEERIYNKRKALEESLKRGFRLRPNPKPRRQFDGTIINRPLKNQNKLSLLKNNGEKSKYNVFTIGNDSLKKGNNSPLRKTIKKKSVIRRAAAQKLEQAKKALNEVYMSSDDDAIPERTKSIALSRTKRQPKVPQLDFKYCYSEGFGMRTRKQADPCKEDQFMEIIDSDSSSVVEVFPPGDKENSEYSESCVSHRRPATNQDFNPSRFAIGSRKGWRPKENKALNLLDKLRLGLQCTVIQTERDVIIQNLTLEDLSTLRSRLQGLATFKNIEAEYDKNGLETARATIDRRVLNLPFKGYDGQFEPRFSYGNVKKSEESLKRKNVNNNAADKKKQLTPGKDQISTNVKIDDYSPTWVRPKVRSVKKIRKLYTQSASTPNILARSQGSSRQDGTSHNSNRQSSGKSSTTDTANNTQHGPTAPVSFYPQITSATPNMPTEPLPMDNNITKAELFQPSTSVIDSSMVPETSSTESTLSSEHNTMATSAQTLSDNSKRMVTNNSVSVAANGTPATAMSASQLLMLKKGAASSASDSASPFTSTISMSGNDQLFANQILKPFKKSIPASSPSKLEIDDEETEFELTPSIIAHSKTADIVHNHTASPTKVSFISKPIIPPTVGILTSPRRTIHLSSTNSLCPINSTIPISSPLPANILITCATKLPIAEPLPVIVSDNTVSLSSVSGGNLNPSVDSGPNPKIKHRKWTHNFLTSNNINFREVLCSATPRTVSTFRALLPATVATCLSPASVRTTAISIGAHITQTIIKSSTTVASDSIIAKPMTTTPTKGSNVVLKSLLVGSNPANDLCHLNKSPLWAAKYLSTNVPVSGQDSKHKWQVGGSVVPSQAGFVTIMAKDGKAIELVDPAGNK